MTMKAETLTKIETLRAYLNTLPFKGLPYDTLVRKLTNNDKGYPSIATLRKYHLLTVTHTETETYVINSTDIEPDDDWNWKYEPEEETRLDDGSTDYTFVLSINYYGLRED